MNKPNFMDDLEVHRIHQLYIDTGMITVIEDGHAAATFNENHHNKKAYEAMNEYGKEFYRNTIAVEMEGLKWLELIISMKIMTY